ncbi:hypothetical protein ColLi_07557 [Colletotrichum liriopes]|uniref:Uncharacterized protein n=1 Tax=Colletotrichum liriopes TaxID=708192 RepID=A0AA37GPB1_9PEZI|nr:hypothetical protein ColLi_07557 [Colletotrichum liriopes]
MTWLGARALKKYPTPLSRWRLSSLPSLERNDIVIARNRTTTRKSDKAHATGADVFAGLVIAYGINSAQNAMMKSDEWKNDARNPLAKKAH